MANSNVYQLLPWIPVYSQRGSGGIVYEGITIILLVIAATLAIPGGT